MTMNLNERALTAAAALVLLVWPVFASARTIGVNPPAQSLTRQRIDELPVAQRKIWLAYLDRSQRKRQADKDAFAAELKREGIKTPTYAPHGFGARSMPLDHEASWYASDEARQIADAIVSFQTPTGGWGKNLDMRQGIRKPGERYVPDNLSHYLAPGDFDTPREPEWNYVGTIDNDATTTELRFLAKVISVASNSEQAERWRTAFIRGVHYLLAAQYPNGGWPQVWPLEGGYHDAITYNDDAMTEVLEVLHSVAEGTGDYSFIPRVLRRQATASFARGVRCILDTQIVAGDKRTAWPQQDDALTLKPTSGRDYEIPALSSGESAMILQFLMNDLPHPTAMEQQAIRAAAAWFSATEIHGEVYERTVHGRDLVTASDAAPLWARYYQIGTNHPIFGDRDKTIHDRLDDLSLERRNGYSWFDAQPMRALDQYVQWAQAHPESK